MPVVFRTLTQAVAYGLAAMIFAGVALAEVAPEGGKTQTAADAASSPPPIESPPAADAVSPPEPAAPKETSPPPSQADAPGAEKPATAEEDAKAPGKLEPVAPSEATAILGKKIKGPDGKDVVGAIVDILVDGQGHPRAALIDFGGYMGVGSRKIAVDWSLLTFRPNDAATPVTLGLDRAEIQAAPEYKDPTQPAEVVEAPPAPTVPAGPAPASENVEPHAN